MTIRIGTSGWHYAHWVGPFYPPGLPRDKMLSFYSAEFEAVEVNSSFYRLPSAEALLAWRESTPHSFTFTLKASRYITHMKKLRGTEDALANLLDRARTLAPKLGPILFQLPPKWRVDIERLRGFLAQIPGSVQAAFEFRDLSWMVDDVYDVLRESGSGFCIYDLSGSISPMVVTSDLVYLRLHGPDGPYRGRYDTGTLSSWAERISAWHGEGKNVFCYFDNDEGGFAVRNARELKALLAL
jgi:uncharacterized protein YecE (DUF72 family)